MRHFKKIFYLFILLFVSFACSKSTKSNPIKILFIGNSYMYYNSSPELVKALINEKFPNKAIEVKLISQGGMTLKRHWEDGKAVEAIKSNDWDYVILQEQSKLGMGLIIDNDFYFGNTDHFYEYSKKFDTEIKNIGAQTAFFMTWSIKQRPEEQDILTHAYSTIAKELDAKLIPIGLVWDKMRTKDAFDIYDPDGSHPSAYGSYVVATSIFSTLLEENPTGLSGIISGSSLSSFGEPSKEIQSLVAISDADALVIQKASWEVVEENRKKGGYSDINEPKQQYTLPKLAKGDIIDKGIIEGRWYGTSTYSSAYLGVILDIEYKGNTPEIVLSFYTPDRQDKVIINNIELLKEQINLTMIDSLRTMSSHVCFSLKENQLLGISKSFGGHITSYKNWTFSRDKIKNNLDLEAVDVLMKLFKRDINKKGYVQAAIGHYKRYSSLINTVYLPEEVYLNAVGHNLLQDKKVKKALDVFELAMTLYPKSVNTYNSYGETLIGAGQHKKGLIIYAKGIALAKKIGDKNSAYMEANFKKFKEGVPMQKQSVAPPPGPPPM